jgi:hypothetical protein
MASDISLVTEKITIISRTSLINSWLIHCLYLQIVTYWTQRVCCNRKPLSDTLMLRMGNDLFHHTWPETVEIDIQSVHNIWLNSTKNKWQARSRIFREHIRKLEGVLGTGWSWLRIRQLAGTFEYGKELSGSIKMRGISWLATKTG